MRVLFFRDLKAKKGIAFSRQHIMRLVKDERFPRPAKLGDTKQAFNAWLESEIDEWLEARAKARDAV
jgi:prophage regulatory protein